MTPQRTLTVLLFEELPGVWVAQIIEKDMAAHGPSMEAAFVAVQAVFQAHVNFDTRHNREPLSLLTPAPKAYWLALEDAEPVVLSSDRSMFLPAHMNAVVSRTPIHAN